MRAEAAAVCFALALGMSVAAGPARGGAAGHAAQAGFLRTQLLVTWYGNPHSAGMGILGELSGSARANGLREQAAAYAPFTDKQIMPAYHLVAVVAQPTAGADAKCRRRESADVIRALLEEARQHGFTLVLDIQPGRSDPRQELEHLAPFLLEPDVYVALDPEFAMAEGAWPGRQIGALRATEINAALDFLERLVTVNRLPPKVLIVHQFRLDMLPDKERIRARPNIDLVLNMDGFGSQALKLASYRAVLRQRALDFAGIKLFYRQDRQLFSPEQVMRLQPQPSVVIYQ